MIDSVGTTKFTWTAGNQLATEDGPWASDTVTNTYNNRFRSALSLQQPTGTWTNGFGNDKFARLTNVISPAGASSYQYRDIALASGDHTACELVARLNLPNTSYITNNHDGLGRLLSTILKSSGDVTLNSHDYLYNNGSQRTRQTFTDSSHSDYTYDNIGQLTIADSTVNTQDRGYFYDAAWNLNFRTNNGALKTFQVDNKNQLTNAPSFAPGNATLTYDANGNLFSKTVYNWWYDYDDENRLVNWYYYSTGQDGFGSPTDNADLKTHFVYDGLGRLRTRDEYGVSSSAPWTWVLVSETRYIYDGMRVIQERDGGNTPTVSYTRGNDLRCSVVRRAWVRGGGQVPSTACHASTRRVAKIISGGIRDQTRLRIVDSNDGRDRTKAQVVDRYNPTKPREGQTREQMNIESRGGIDNLDNKINAMSPDKYKRCQVP